MTDTILSAAAAQRCIVLENQVASMEEQMARLVIRLKYWREERDRQARIAGHHARRQKQAELETPDA
ncbi:hypothetical protein PAPPERLAPAPP_00790 [Brevundimonas phage vB_BpoS-Papperlapapp]|uniref:Uncharacterized protein n=1 Tax=Brevundimonas phage vB_BpoS-Domovoi TaxID=2948598 RepID=A0A9E7MSH9_9CAUD|nr:hypothetical protein DOMOVOI_05570 [Brevundimonas phage vB_BpoS-Domovoi]USN15821.1 hypothetical protein PAPPERLAPAPP_00790 [Brevundimonas phage vB_BpoS-Papperlapapp]